MAHWTEGTSDSDDSDHVQTDIALNPPAICNIQEVHLCLTALQVKGHHLIPISPTMLFAVCLKLTETCPRSNQPSCFSVKH